MKKQLITMAFVIPFMLTGCVVSVDGHDDGWSSDWQHTEKANRQAIAKLDTGMSIGEVKKVMGLEDFNEMYQRDGKQVQVLFYRTQRQQKDGITTKSECTPLVFKNGLLVGWGDTAYHSI